MAAPNDVIERWSGAASGRNRACFEAGLAPGLLVEPVVVAAPVTAANMHRNA